VFQIYPANADKKTFYALPDNRALFLFIDSDEGRSALLGQTHARDEYIYFKPIKQPVYTLRLIIAADLGKAKAALNRRLE
jgi:hypothetical protein